MGGKRLFWCCGMIPKSFCQVFQSAGLSLGVNAPEL